MSNLNGFSENNSKNEQLETDWNEILNTLVKNEKNSLKWKNIIESYKDISYDDAKLLKDGYYHAAHAFIWARNSQKLWGFDLHASVLMQMRFDGSIGFPGGMIDKTDNSWEDGLNRELCEEINLNPKYFLNRNDYFYSSINSQRKLILHFYLKEVDNEEFKQIEIDSLESHDYGGEVMGLIRPPLFEIAKRRGFSLFINNQFIGNALLQLFKAIIYLKIIPKERLIFSIDSS